jgi:hypothetical protein
VDLSFLNMGCDQIYIYGDKEEGYKMEIYPFDDDTAIWSYDELKKFANTLLVELEKEANNGNL